jgi:Zn-finger nucleic acid-binding protein
MRQVASARALACPDCHEPLVRRHERALELDACARCGGVWFDRGEIEAHRERESVRSGRASSPVQFVRNASASQRRCPGCAASSLASGQAGALRVLRCEACGGTFVRGRTRAVARGTLDVAGNFVGEGIAELAGEALWRAVCAIVDSVDLPGP